VTNYDNLKAVFDTIINEFKRIDCLLCCAGKEIDFNRTFWFKFYQLGLSKPGFFINQDVNDFKFGMELNYFGSLNCSKVNNSFQVF
jgi:NAD(P)-dependent dehydrogenase (short-subunit alcohol dehydrogenase family)